MALIVRTTPSSAYERIMSDLWNIKETATVNRGIFQTATDSRIVLEYHLVLLTKRNFLTLQAGVRGLPPYARAQEDNPGYDIAAEWAATLAAMEGVLDFIEANFPASTYLSFDATTGQQVYQSIPSGQLVPLRALMQTLIDSIDTTET